MAGILNTLLALGGLRAFLKDPSGYTDNAVIPGTADIQLRFSSGGDVESSAAPAGFVVDYAWLRQGTASLYELFVHNTGPDALASGTLDTWLALSTSRTYRLTRSSLGNSDADLEVQIRLASTGQVLATADVNLSANGI